MGFPLFGNQLQEVGMIRVEREGRVNVNPLDLSCIITGLQRQLAHTVACSNNKDNVIVLQNAQLIVPRETLGLMHECFLILTYICS